MADKVDERLLTTTLRKAAENNTVSNKTVAPLFPEKSQQSLSWARIHLAKYGLLEPVTEADYKITEKGRELAREGKPITFDYLRSLSQVGRRREVRNQPVHPPPVLARQLPLNLILYGPPGTGKTRKILEEYIPQFADGQRYEMVTFHPSYSYEEFMEGLRPVIQPGNDQNPREEEGEPSATERAGTAELVRYEIVPGVFRRICQRAAADPDKRYALFIDEINRGNVPALFGELITLVEEDKRGGQVVTLPYSGERFSVPRNLHIIGTMNTADRSIALLDVALRRRFEFEEIGVDYDVLRNELQRVQELDQQGLDVEKMLRRMNERISYLYDQDHCIGHGWLISVSNLTDLCKTFNCKIIPLLREYFYDDWTKVCRVLGEHPEQSRMTDFITKRKLSAENLFGRAQDLGKDKWLYSVGDYTKWQISHFTKVAESPVVE
jgi:hypothetical protein